MLSRILRKSTGVVFRQRAAFASGILGYHDIANFTEEQLEFRSQLRRFCDSVVAPLAAETDRNNAFPNHLWKEFGSMGLLGATVPAEFGGSELGYTTHTLIMEEISRASGSIGLSYGAHTALCVGQIERQGPVEQKKKYLPGLCSGDYIGALAMSEPGSGSDVTSMKLRADKHGDKYVLNGNKMWITNGPDAHVYVVYAKTDVNAGHKGITAFLVERDWKGFSRSPKLDKLGMRGSNTCELVFENVEVPAENVLGNIGQGVYVLMDGLDYERLVLSAGPLGIMQGAFDYTLQYIKDREQFGKKIGEFQLMQGKIADMYVQLQTTRATLYSICRMADQHKISNTDCAAIILHASQSSVALTMEAIQALGGNGYMREYPVERMMRDAKLYDIGAGTNEIRKWLIGRELFKNGAPSN